MSETNEIVAKVTEAKRELADAVPCAGQHRRGGQCGHVTKHPTGLCATHRPGGRKPRQSLRAIHTENARLARIEQARDAVITASTYVRDLAQNLGLSYDEFDRLHDSLAALTLATQENAK